MARFSLLDEGWIPVMRNDGTTVEVGLREALLDAPTFRGLACSNPLEQVVLIRLLVAILLRCVGPPDAASWGSLREAGRFDPTAVGGYLDRWADRFDLFHPERPFLQTPGLPSKYFFPITKLRFVMTRNPTLFDHTHDDLNIALTPAEATLAMLVIQQFDLGGTTGGPASENKAKESNLTKAAIVTMQGSNLFETLLLNLPRYNPHSQPEFDPGRDLPAWERDEPVRPASRKPDGPADYLTWQSRRVLLYPEKTADGIVVRRAALMKGWQIESVATQKDWEPMVAFRSRAKAKEGEGWFPVQYDEER
ncbi:MAG: type I-E CRISPR-associated protein Cse1/CasA, partial [Dehalococcoidia bacterium]|nr:type I-E CRISPR-associated protein Cse1/CasA [Dehalococcoidia bacterium]